MILSLLWGADAYG